jgi:four helix bundle protein
MLNLSHKKLDVWKLAITFVKEIYKATQKFPKSEIYGLTNQLRRAAVSVPSNIAEGASRNSVADRKRFYQIARSSLVEIDTQLEVALELKFCSEETISVLGQRLNHLFAMTTNLIKSTN